MTIQVKLLAKCENEGCEAHEEYWGDLKSDGFIGFGLFGSDPKPTPPENWQLLKEYKPKDGDKPRETKRIFLVCPPCLEELKKTPGWKKSEEEP